MGIEYKAQAASPLINGEIKLTISEAAFTAAALFDVVEVPLAEVNAITIANHVVMVKTDSGDYTFSRMGEWAQRFYDAVCDAYNKAVLRSLFVPGNPLVTAKGSYSYAENGAVANGNAPVQVYERSLVVLPPDLSARRVPLCFLSGLDKGDYTITLRLDTGESYSLSKLGYDAAAVEAAIEKQLRALREKALTMVKEIDPALTTAQATQLAKLLPEGAAAQFGQLARIAPSFALAVETKIGETRAADSYNAFKELCNPANIYVGFRKSEADKDAADGQSLADIGAGGIGAGGAGGIGGIGSAGGQPVAGGSLLDSLPDAGGGSLLDSMTGGNEQAQPAMTVWLVAPSSNGQFAAVEFAEADSATFVYRTNGDFDAFMRQLNRALEAIDFKREVIRLSDEELRNPENADYYMAAKRTAALQFVRANFLGRVIHSGLDSWKRKLIEIWNGSMA